MIIIKKVNKSYGSAKVLKDISLVLNDEITVICGPSGSGKSTLIKTLNGLEPIQSGQIIIDSVGLAEWTPKELATTVGIVFQDFALFKNMTVLENLVIPQVTVLDTEEEAAVAKAKEMLKKVSMNGYEDRMPDTLSGGQQQRVAIARSLVMSPKYILFDEPTSSLDPEMASDVLNVIELLSEQNVPMVIVTHEMSFARKIGDRILFMDNGQVIEDSKPEAFFMNPKSSRAKEFISKVVR